MRYFLLKRCGSVGLAGKTAAAFTVLLLSFALPPCLQLRSQFSVSRKVRQSSWPPRRSIRSGGSPRRRRRYHRESTHKRARNRASADPTGTFHSRQRQAGGLWHRAEKWPPGGG